MTKPKLSVSRLTPTATFAKVFGGQVGILHDACTEVILRFHSIGDIAAEANYEPLLPYTGDFTDELARAQMISFTNLRSDDDVTRHAGICAAFLEATQDMIEHPEFQLVLDESGLRARLNQDMIAIRCHINEGLEAVRTIMSSDVELGDHTWDLYQQGLSMREKLVYSDLKL